jgi:hypothetical protein
MVAMPAANPREEGVNSDRELMIEDARSISEGRTIRAGRRTQH